METIIYKGVEIQKTQNGNFIFHLDGAEHINTNLHFAKVMISRELKNKPKP
jgi:hypothetical protein